MLKQSSGHTAAYSSTAFRHLTNQQLVGWLDNTITALPKQSTTNLPLPVARLLHVQEIFADEASNYRKALANAYAALDPQQPCSLVYLLEGSPQGVQLYFGVMAAAYQQSHLPEARKLLLSSLEGQLPGLALREVDKPQTEALLQTVLHAPQRGLLYGVPHGDTVEEAADFQGLERLVRSLLVGADGRSGEHWQLALFTRPLPTAAVHSLLEQALELTTEVAARARSHLQYGSNQGEQSSVSQGSNSSDSSNTTTSKSEQRGKSESGTQSDTNSNSSGSSSSSSSTSHADSRTTGTQESVTKTSGSSQTRTHGTNQSESVSRSTGTNVSISAELTDKRLHLLVEHLEEWLLPRLQQGVTRGLFSTQVLLAAETPSAYQRLANIVRATFQGQGRILSPLEIVKLPAAQPYDPLTPFNAAAKRSWQELCHSRHEAHTLLTAEEVAVLAGLPQRELPGLARLPTAHFALSLPKVSGAALPLGQLVDHGRKLDDLTFQLARADLNKHVFVTGVTGAGKTTTCLKLLLSSQLPFLVIEPAKTEYRALYPHCPTTLYYRPLADKQHSFRLNPLELVHREQQLSSHVEFLSSVLSAVFPMEASMPYLVKQAIQQAYMARGWDIASNEWLGGDDPFDPAQHAWPNLSEMISHLDTVIQAQGMGKEFEEKYRGSLVSRLTDLTRGPLGVLLDVRHGLDWAALLNQQVVLELEEVKSPEGKALLMALVLGNLAEAVKARHARDAAFQHLTLVEEAHRLLSQPEPGAENSRRLAVEAFADMLAEIRKYGAGLIVVDQIPAKLIPDVLKNTHTKIVHRIFAADDRRALGDAMLMDDEQRQFLPKLATGQAVIYCGGWHTPALVQIQPLAARGELPDAAGLAQCAWQQLWAQRARYYPTFSRLPCADNPNTLATWVKAAQQALTAWLTLNPKRQPRLPEFQQRLARQRLQQFYRTWQPQFAAQQAQYDAWRQNNAPDAPADLFTAAVLAVACDSNPLPRVEVKGWQPLDIRFTSSVWTAAIQAWLTQLAALSADAQDLPASSDVDLAEVQAALAAYERF